MGLHQLRSLLVDEPALVSVIGRGSAVLSVPEPARAITIAGLAHANDRRPIVVTVPTSTDAERLANDLEVFLSPADVARFPAWETLPFERVSPSVETMGRRLELIWRLRNPDHAPRVVVAPVRALIQRLGPHVADVEPIVIRAGDSFDPVELVNDLVAVGYRREHQVEHRGEVAVRGSIVDIFPSTADGPVRVDLWGDEVDRLTDFAVADQRSIDDVDEVRVFPARELLATDTVRARAEKLLATEPWGREHWERLAEGAFFDGMESWLPWLTEGDLTMLDMVGEGGQILLVEPRRMRDRAADLLAEEVDLASTLARTWGAVAKEGDAGRDATSAFPRLHIEFDRLLTTTEAPVWTITTIPEGPDIATVSAAGWDPVVGDDTMIPRELSRLLADGYRVVVAADGPGSAARVADLLAAEGVALTIDEAGERDLTKPGGTVVIAPLERGFLLPEVKLAVLAEADITGRRRAHRRARPRRRAAQGFFDDLTPGDYVVHHLHGVARYGGMVKRAIGGNERDYLLLEYRGNDKVYVPSDQIDVVRHYTSGENPTLSRLNGSEWQKTKSKVRSAVEEIAQELVVLYQQRMSTPGHAYAPDSPWQREMEDAFPFEETPDQLEAIIAVKDDMESESAMDRLVCGDVGFGKTEVAIRAVFKAIQDGRQAAVLVPTTLLAQQHFQTFSERFAPYPVRVEVISRFLTTGQAKKVIAALETGEVDLVIGTHRLLSGDVKFKNLGLLVVDEEQRFGVSHKESIKQFKANVDVLTLTATPIPRTLEMSLTGIRDLSLLNTAPAERQPILTYVGEYDNRAVGEAIRRELLREGQVFFVHNRVLDIDKVANELRELVPEARIAVAHGQMDEGSLETVVLDFWQGEYDVLVCTTIIESGIDMPTVNTLVVDRADRLGLGQLHQLRGRVGRAGQRAYAYLFTPPDMVLSETAYERLKTIGEATELGSGFKIAMRDLEIRGAGNLLGTGQTGHVSAVGYDLYCQMVNEVVAELKGEAVREPAEIKLDLPFDAHLSEEYIPTEEQRLEAYRRLAAVTTHEEVDDIVTEWTDRYGPVPAAAAALVEVARLRAECARVGVKEVVVLKGAPGGGFGGPSHTAKLSPLKLRASQKVRMERLIKGGFYKEDLEQVQVPIKKASQAAQTVIDFLQLMEPVEAQ